MFSLMRRDTNDTFRRAERLFDEMFNGFWEDDFFVRPKMRTRQENIMEMTENKNIFKRSFKNEHGNLNIMIDASGDYRLSEQAYNMIDKILKYDISKDDYDVMANMLEKSYKKRQEKLNEESKEKQLEEDK